MIWHALLRGKESAVQPSIHPASVTMASTCILCHMRCILHLGTASTMNRYITVIYSNIPCNVSIKAIDSGGMDTLKMAGNGFVFLGLDIVLYPSGLFSVTEFQ